jgi:drug/metabolite transporter (DMT)-like permease
MTHTKLSPSRLVGIYASLTILAVVWGNAFVAIRHAVQFMTPVELAAARFLPVVILMGGWLLTRDRAGLWQLLREEWLRSRGWRWPASPRITWRSTRARRITWGQIVGGALIVAGMIAVNWR